MRSLFTRQSVVRDLRTALVAVVAASVVVATPSVAAKVKNADKVDGKHAVGAKAKPAKRAGKLVATDKTGRLPNDIIAKAPDADRLDGQDSTAFRPRQAASGELMTGIFAVLGHDYQEVGVVSFLSALSTPLPLARTTVVPPGGATAQCPAVGQVTPSGWLCVYETTNLKVTGMAIMDPGTTAAGVNRAGFMLNPLCDPGTCFVEGVWAVRAP